MSVTTRYILYDLMDRYGNIMPDNLKENKLRINYPIDPSVTL